MELSKEEQVMLNRFVGYVSTHEVSNEFLVQLIELSGGYLNLQTIPDYAKSHHMSYNGVKKTRRIVVLFGVKYVVDNE